MLARLSEIYVPWEILDPPLVLSFTANLFFKVNMKGNFTIESA